MRTDTSSNLSSALCPLSSDTGFTLIELVMTIIIMGFLSLILVPFFNSITHSPDPMIRQQAVALGQAMMDEILAKKWDEKTPAGGGPLITDLETLATAGTCCPGATSTSCEFESSCTPNGNHNRLYCYIQCNGHSSYTPGTATVPGTDAPEAGRADWDDVDDYHNFSETDDFTDQEGNSFTMTGYKRRVSVTYIASDSDPIDETTPAVTPQTTDTKRIIVTVESPLGETFRLVAVACNY